MISIQKGSIKITESELKQIVKEVDRTKRGMIFTDEPMPMSDMSEGQYRIERMKRGEILVEPRGGGLSFVVDCSNKTESRGYFVNY